MGIGKQCVWKKHVLETRVEIPYNTIKLIHCIQSVFSEIFSLFQHFTEIGVIVARVDAHISAVKRISFTTWTGRTNTKQNNNKGAGTASKMYFLSQTMDDIKIYDLESFHIKYELSHDRHESASASGYVSTTTPTSKGVDIGRLAPVRSTGATAATTAGNRFGQTYLGFDVGWDADTQIIVAGFLPHTNKTYVVLSNDTIQMWQWGLRAMRQCIQPLRMRSRYLRRNIAEPLEVFYDPSEAVVDELVAGMTRATPRNVISDVQFSRNGVYCSISLQFLNEILIFRTSTAAITSRSSFTSTAAYIPLWDIYKVIKLHDYSIAKTRFISPWLPAGHPLTATSADAKYLMVHSVRSVNDLILVDVDNLNKKVLVNKGSCHSFDVSPNGKMLATVLDAYAANADVNKGGCDNSGGRGGNEYANAGGGEVVVLNLQHYFDKLSDSRLPLLGETTVTTDISSANNMQVAGDESRWQQQRTMNIFVKPMVRTTKRLEAIKQEVSYSI